MWRLGSWRQMYIEFNLKRHIFGPAICATIKLHTHEGNDTQLHAKHVHTNKSTLIHTYTCYWRVVYTYINGFQGFISAFMWFCFGWKLFLFSLYFVYSFLLNMREFETLVYLISPMAIKIWKMSPTITIMLSPIIPHLCANMTSIYLLEVLSYMS